ncbi:glutamate receptor ionotropic, kainate glr-3-like [Oppia nitens]|uniref:glutamate receptor ionotropic, kainate glr-3-like n=1 Tax=Oppia nitens TaxID=1686743 RepID=UPI0023DAE1AA|nr:glutamate receptor ionotropic, kainate glr-3-like [Oppia nitens]
MIYVTTFLLRKTSVQLRGVTLSNWPYVDRYRDKDGQIAYDGFAIEVIDRISKSAGFDYDLYEVPDGKYGVYDNETGRFDGLIGELVANRADFAVADLTINDERRAFVNFTEPFMTTSLAAIVHRKHADHILSFVDLYHQSEVKYGVIDNSATALFFHNSRDDILRKMYVQMTQHPFGFVATKEEGLKMVNESNYALITESVTLEYLSNIQCDLVIVNDTNSDFRDFQRHYAIGLRRGSQYLNAFNFAIDELKNSGELDQIRDSYWVNECVEQTEEYEINGTSNRLTRVGQVLILLMTLVMTLFII